jgi:hypothetical protein
LSDSIALYRKLPVLVNTGTPWNLSLIRRAYYVPNRLRQVFRRDIYKIPLISRRLQSMRDNIYLIVIQCNARLYYILKCQSHFLILLH